MIGANDKCSAVFLLISSFKYASIFGINLVTFRVDYGMSLPEQKEGF